MRGQGKDEDSGRKRLSSAAGMCAVSAGLTEKGHRAAEAKVKSWRKTRGTAEPGEGGGGNRKEEREPSKPAAGAGAPRHVAPPCLEGPGRRRPRQSPGPRLLAHAHLGVGGVAFCSYSPILSPRRRTLPGRTQAVRAGRKYALSAAGSPRSGRGNASRTGATTTGSSGRLLARGAPRRAGAGPGAGHYGKEGVGRAAGTHTAVLEARCCRVGTVALV